MKSMKSLTMKQRLKVCAIILWRVLFELCVYIPVGAFMSLVLLAIIAVAMLWTAILDRNHVGDRWDDCRGIVYNTFQKIYAYFKCRFDVTLLANQILEK